ncbi:alginate O-acetyltransferase AlgF [Acetobacteraceae bacterium H6797]|nr:alginate O-acetyltransferase AlgF [Acetobacteraceae bacterium H6797]
MRALRRLALAASLTVLGAFAAPAMAQQILYEPVPPPGSAYLRFVNTLGAEVTVKPDFLAERRMGTAPEDRVGGFAVVEKVAGRQLRVELAAGTATGRASLTIEPGSFNTILIQPGPGGTLAALPVQDDTAFNQNRARLAFYNAIPGCADGSLMLEPGKQAVFQGVAPGKASARSVNPVTAQLLASCGGRSAPVFDLKGVEAGGMYSIWLMQPGGEPLAFVTRDRTLRWQP